MHRRCDRNRKRSKRRAIYCPIHGCYLDSVSQKYSLFANRTAPLQPGGLSRHNALILVETETAVHLESEWLEAFWCNQCQETKWYHVQKTLSKGAQEKLCTYEVSVAPPKLWLSLKVCKTGQPWQKRRNNSSISSIIENEPPFLPSPRVSVRRTTSTRREGCPVLHRFDPRQQAVGVIHRDGNPSVGEFIADMQKGMTTKAARTSGLKVERRCSRQSVKYRISQGK